MADINAIAEQIQGLTLIDASQLVKLLEEKLGVRRRLLRLRLHRLREAALRRSHRLKRRQNLRWC